MKILFISTLFTVSLSCPLSAQNNSFKVLAGEVPVKKIRHEDQFRLPSFQEATVHFQNGQTANAWLNYNFMYGKMFLLNSQKDTLALADEYKIKKITFIDYLFYYDVNYGYLEVVSSYPEISLAKHKLLKVVRNRQQTNNGYASSTDETSSHHNYYMGDAYADGLSLTSKSISDLVFQYQVSYLIIDKNGRIHPGKSAVKKIYPQHRKSINEYLKEQRTDWNDEDDLRQLLSFCSDLQK